MKSSLCLFLLIATTTLSFNQHPANEPAPAEGQQTTAAADRFEASKNKIQERIPSLNEMILNCDMGIIENALPVVTEKFKTAGFTKEDASDAAYDGWVNVRLYSRLPHRKCMNLAAFQEYVGSFGRMYFRSSPAGATIELDSKPLNQNTDSKRWFEPREYKVKYIKPDCCLPVETTCTITENAETDCFAQLPRKP